MNDVDMIIAVIVLLGLCFTAVCQVVRNVRYREMVDERTRMLPWLMTVVVATVLCDLPVGGELYPRLMLDLSLGLVSLTFLTSSLWTYDSGRRPLLVVMSVQGLLALYYILCAFDIIRIMSVRVTVSLVLIVVTVLGFQTLTGIWRRVRTVRTVMKSGTVWVGLCLCVDVVYMTVVLIEAVLYAVFGILFGKFSGLSAMVVVILYALTLIMMAFRIINDSLFSIMHRHERRIVESLKVSQIEVSGDKGKDDYLYREIYYRVVAYFENEKPYLNGDLTINDLVKVLYSNKLYISKAISHFTGRNFCQFVNYYRVIYSVERFRDNPELKVLELSSLCGFNSMVSYNMAFRLFMGETPSEWCRKEKSRIVKERK